MNKMELVVYGTRDATIAGISVVVEGVTYTADGTAKREPHDNDDPEIASLLAIGRALDNLSNKLLKKANGLVKHNDDMKKYRVEQKAKSAKTPVKRKPVNPKKAGINKSLAKASSKG